MQKKELLALVQLAKEKNQKAQTKLINIYWIDVFSFTLKKVRDKNLADEITVSVFAKVLSKIDLYDPNFEFKTWILTIAQNTIIDFWRKNARSNETSTDHLEDVENTFAQSPEELLISDEDHRKFLKIVESLDSNYQSIIKLRFYEEKSIKEISEELGISISNTKVRIMRAKKVLAQLLKDNNYHDF
ncbi:RNA polymerase sigma factor [Frigoriflavimonas asaccharolytica]|nr:sigma-70 family RNA polymerase sigma factor [Frigoriflavimonas asaccharolytica]